MMTPLLLLLATVAVATKDLRHYGSSLIITPRRSNLNGTLQLEVSRLQTLSDCHISDNPCLYGDCEAPTETDVTRVAWNSQGFACCLLEVKTKIQLQHNYPIAFGYPMQESYNGSVLWIPNIRGASAAWAMMAHVDLGIRSDTHEPNSPPISAMLPIIRVTKNCPRTFTLLTFDPDGDHVTCRIPTSSWTNECGLCGVTSGFSLDQDSCSLTYSNDGATGNHPIELMIEDFPHQQIKLQYSQGHFTIKYPLLPVRLKRDFKYTVSPLTSATAPTTTLIHVTPAQFLLNSIPPLSKVPLQFTVHVDSHDAPSCHDGAYFPVFLEPTPSKGAILPVFFGQTLEIKVRSAAEYSNIRNLNVIGPGGVRKNFISTGFYIIKWQPKESDVKGHFPICFISHARDSLNQVYESEPRCVTVQVEHYEVVVTCNETTMTVEVKKNSVIKQNEKKLRLNDDGDSSCSLTKHSNASHLVAMLPLSACGTYVEENENNIVYMNEITSTDPNEGISGQNEVEISFSCTYPKRINLTVGFRDKNPNTVNERGLGGVNFQFEFFKGPQFRKHVDGGTFPADVSLKQMIYMQIEATPSIPDTELFVESCRATPSKDPESRTSYSIIENGCVKDKTVKIYNGSRSQFRFGMEAFQFIGAHDEAYITCSVLMCESGNPDTRCSQGCIRGGKPRRKRVATAQTDSHMVSQGPFRLVTGVSVPTLKLVLNLVLAVCCLVACVVVVHRSWRSWSSRRSRDSYQRLPTFEVD